jgi:hypothetical protein
MNLIDNSYSETGIFVVYQPDQQIKAGNSFQKMAENVSDYSNITEISGQC